MEPPSPARLYATLAGAILFVAGILGFFHDLSWVNFLHVATGALGLLLAGWAARAYSVCLGATYTALGIWGLVGNQVGDDWAHLALGLLGLAAAASTRGSLSTNGVQKEPRGRRTSEPRAQAAAKGP